MSIFSCLSAVSIRYTWKYNVSSKYSTLRMPFTTVPKLPPVRPGAIWWTWSDYKGTRAERTTRPSAPPTQQQPKQQPKQQPEPTQHQQQQSRNNREASCTKMAEREPMRQMGMNPFVNTDYVKGVEIRDKFLLPKNEERPRYAADPNE